MRHFQTLAIHKLPCRGVDVIPVTRRGALAVALCWLNTPGELLTSAEWDYRVAAAAWERLEGEAMFGTCAEKVLVLAAECCCRSCPEAAPLLGQRWLAQCPCLEPRYLLPPVLMWLFAKVGNEMQGTARLKARPKRFFLAWQF